MFAAPFGCSSTTTTSQPATQPSTSTSPTASVPIGNRVTRRDLIGDWEPKTPLGRDVRTIGGRRGSFAFHAVDRLAGGSNGCNVESCHYRLGPGDRFRAGLFSTTTRRCETAYESRVPYAGVMARARSARLAGEELRLFASDGGQLAEYIRATVQRGWVAAELSLLPRARG